MKNIQKSPLYFVDVPNFPSSPCYTMFDDTRRQSKCLKPTSLASTDAANPFEGAHGVVLAHPPSLENQRPAFFGWSITMGV